MSVARINELPSLGSGLGYRDPFLTDLFRQRSAVDFLEIVADHFLVPTDEKSRELDLLAVNLPLIPHALDLSLGSVEGIDPHYLDRLGELIDRVNPPWWSEHIAFTRAGIGNGGSWSETSRVTIQIRQRASVVTETAAKVMRNSGPGRSATGLCNSQSIGLAPQNGRFSDFSLNRTSIHQTAG